MERELGELQAAIRACTRCRDDGTLPEVHPVVEGAAGARFFLVGQAPGPIEKTTGRPFSGRAGKELARWLERAGFGAGDEFRRHVYLAALGRCFPGRTPAGTGDLPPSRRQRANCLPWLEAELALLRPRVLITVGKLATDHFLGQGALGERVGRSFGRDPVVVPLPHPSGQSRWLNQVTNRELLDRALGLLAELHAGTGSTTPPVSRRR